MSPDDRTDAELVGELERLSFAAVQRLRWRAEAASSDPVRADEVFVVAGQLAAVLAAAAEQVRLLREDLDQAAREDSPA